MTTRNANNPYLGRLGAILDDAAYLLNDEEAPWHTVAGLAGMANRGYQKIAAEGLWSASTTVNMVVDQEAYDLAATIPRLIAINSVRNGTNGYLQHYLNYPDLDSRRQTELTPPGPTVGYYVDLGNLTIINAPASDGLTSVEVFYSYSPGDLGTLVTPNAAAVVNLGGGLVGIPATLHGLAADTATTFYGTTNYNGNYTLHANTTTNQIVITATYVAETLTATAGIQPVASYTPAWPIAYDDVLQYFVCWQAWARDTSRDNYQAEREYYRSLYEQAKADLYDAFIGDEGLSLEPGR